MKSECVITTCKCSHEYQDQKYGKGNRVHNPAKPKAGKATAIRCTVCGETKEYHAAEQ